MCNPAGESVKISQPVSVTPTVCSNCAESERSRVTAVQPSANTAIGAGYRPLVGDFTGAGGTSSILWYAPGTNPELLYRGD